jgi:sortase A
MRERKFEDRRINPPFAKWLELLLWLVAALALCIFGITRAETWLYQEYADWKLQTAVQATPGSSPVPASEGSPLGRLEIPSIGLSAIFVEGAGSSTLRRGIGHIPGTALPGAEGNTGLSGHRDTFFRHLGEIRFGDPITISTLAGDYDYVVDSIQIVNPDESIVLHDIGRPVLTLVTCYPFRYVGPAPKRFIVHASLRTTPSRGAKAPRPQAYSWVP